jgi:uncharacterized protein YqfA (UPF0365 family)
MVRTAEAAGRTDDTVECTVGDTVAVANTGDTVAHTGDTVVARTDDTVVARTDDMVVARTDGTVVARMGGTVVVARTDDTECMAAVAHTVDTVSKDSTYSFLLFDSVFGVADPRQSSSELRQPAHM